jgi:hypothetical protein
LWERHPVAIRAACPSHSICSHFPDGNYFEISCSLFNIRFFLCTGIAFEVTAYALNYPAMGDFGYDPRRDENFRCALLGTLRAFRSNSSQSSCTMS